MPAVGAVSVRRAAERHTELVAGFLDAGQGLLALLDTFAGVLGFLAQLLEGFATADAFGGLVVLVDLEFFECAAGLHELAHVGVAADLGFHGLVVELSAVDLLDDVAGVTVLRLRPLDVDQACGFRGDESGLPAVHGALGREDVDLDLGVHVPVAQDAAVALFHLRGAPVEVDVREGDHAVLGVHAHARDGAGADHDGDFALAGAAEELRHVLGLAGLLGVLDEGDLVLGDAMRRP